MFLDRQRARAHLLRRGLSKQMAVSVAVLVLAAVFVLIIAFMCLRKRRRGRSHHKPSKHTASLKPSIFSMERWRKKRQPGLLDPSEAGSMRETESARRPSTTSNATAPSLARIASATSPVTATTTTTTQTPTTAEVDRRTSVRSIMTLPVYRPAPLATERVLGREGDRDGVDVVLEHPTADQEEELRDEEMEALYQIRLFRRQQVADREERRRLRQEARARGDRALLDDLRTHARADDSAVMLEGLRAEHQRIKETRKRSTSSVSYADVGIARHDGTRLRANSTESERCGLLSDAASMALSAPSRDDGGGSAQRLSGEIPARHHRRGHSVGSVFSVDTNAERSRSRADSAAGDTPRISVDGAGTGAVAGSSPVIIETSMVDAASSVSPPGYEEVSLEDVRSPATTPYRDPPPGYSGPEPSDVVSVSSLESEEGGGGGGSASVSVSGSVSVSSPSQRRQRLRLSVGGVPQIVVQPSSADAEGRGSMW